MPGSWIVKKRLGLHVLPFGKAARLIFDTKSPYELSHNGHASRRDLPITQPLMPAP